MREETQKAPNTIAPTKTNAAQTASTLSFIVTSTRGSSVAVVLTQNLAENRVFQKRVDLLQCRRVLCTTHFSPALFANIMRSANNFVPTKRFRD
jgi:hypothetical protein